MFNKLAIPSALIALVVIGALRSSPAESAEVNRYHEEVRSIIESIPVDINGWQGEKVPLPQSATNLLRPNGLNARRYVHSERGLSATLMIVQCRDARDMAGHYPPRCYPANGWLTPDDSQDKFISVDGQRMAVYEYHRLAGQNERDITVYNLFALPTGELSVNMRDVYRLSADYQYRYYGAAQVQIIIDGTVDPADHEWILNEMYTIVRSSIDRVRSTHVETAPKEGSAS